MGGSRSGKTFLLTRAVCVRAHLYAGTRHAIIRNRLNAVRNTIGMDTLPKVLALCFPALYVRALDNGTRFVFPNGSEIWLLGLDDKERVDKILGFEFSTIYFNECSQISWGSADTALTRLAQRIGGCKQRAYYDLNPTGNRHWTYRQFIEKKTADGRKKLRVPENFQWMKLNPVDNLENLSQEYLDELEHSGPRTRKRFWEGEYTPEIDNALWTIEKIEQNRELEIDPDTEQGQNDLKRLGISRIVVAVDPSGTTGDEEERSGDVGITVCARTPGNKGRGFLLDDATGNYHPSVWAAIVVKLVDKWKADCVVAEKNYGGEMVRHTIKTANPYARVKVVTASRGKHIRAEPIAALSDEGRISHCGRFDDLEDELCNMSTDGYHGQLSPNRLDAMVWGFTELFEKAMVSSSARVITGPAPFFQRETV